MHQHAKHNGPFVVYVDRLRGDATQPLDGELSVEALAIDDSDGRVDVPAKVSGEAAFAEEDLIIRFSASMTASVPCTVCNAGVPTEVQVNDCIHGVPQEEYAKGTFDASELIREELVMALPRFVECDGKCPSRETLGAYLGKDRSGEESGEEPTDSYRPFADL